MTASRPHSDQRIVQEFKPTNGTVVGWLGLAAAAGIAGWLLVTEPSWRSVQVSLALALAGVVIWVTQLRPRARASAEILTLQNMLRDTHVPLARIDAVTVRQTLNVWVGEQRFVCVGIGRSARSILKKRNRGAMAWIGLEQADDKLGLTHVGEMGTSGPYHQFVENRILDLAESARRDHRGGVLEVRRAWARAELAALGVLAAALLLSLIVG